MTKNVSDSPDSWEPLTPRQEFALARTAEPGVVFRYEREREMPGKERLDAFVYQDRAWLLYWQVDEDENYDEVAFQSSDPLYQGKADAQYSYTLDNGQVDAYPCSWTIPVEEALRAIEYFLNGGTMAPWVHWHEDRD